MKCIVKSCKHDFHQAAPGFSKHRFPRDEALRLLWIKAVALGNNQLLDPDTNYESVLICSDHFTPECFSDTKARKTLRRESIPTVFGNVLVDMENLKTIFVPKPVLPDVKIPEPPVWVSKCPQKAKTRTQKLIERALRYAQIEQAESAPSNFRLKRFPHVCRMCFKPNSSQVLMVSLSTADPAMGEGTISDFIARILAPIVTFDESKKQLLPQAICLPCLELLRFFARYYSKITTLHLLMNSLLELKRQNFDPIVQFFNTESNQVRTLIKDLDLCSLKDYSVDDLLEEFPTYDLASFEGFGKEESKEAESHIPVEESTTKNIKTEHNQLDLFATDILDDVPIKVKKRRKRAPVQKLEEPLQCEKCPYSAYNKRTFQSHKLLHDVRKPKSNACKKPGCSEVFQSRLEYVRHVKIAHKAYVCEICGHRCVSMAYLKNHVARHLKKFEHLCPYCKRGHNTKADLRIHIQIMHLNTYSYRCETCAMTFRKKSSRDEHQLGHSNVYAFPCLQCDKKFKKPQFLKSHVSVVHEKNRVLCPHCNGQFVSRYKLNNHIEQAHGIQIRFVCDVCVQTFNSQDKLDSHRERHDKPHEMECPRCLVLFASNEMFKDHLCITYRDDYVCCGRDHRYHLMYNKHMFLKHGIRMNARVKPIPGQLMGAMRAKRKRIEMCLKCEQIFPTRTLKKQHMEICMAEVEALEEDGADIDIECTEIYKHEVE
ncbi:zinc finger protein 30-like [Armigeres subalbatus]|uniref:zinc finger protein 30-like n=1 Tax=Armigeres subalbatus TaxID=124917 RepID=UPI002ED5DBEA